MDWFTDCTFMGRPCNPNSFDEPAHLGCSCLMSRNVSSFPYLVKLSNLGSFQRPKTCFYASPVPATNVRATILTSLVSAWRLGPPIRPRTATERRDQVSSGKRERTTIGAPQRKMSELERTLPLFTLQHHHVGSTVLYSKQPCASDTTVPHGKTRATKHKWN